METEEERMLRVQARAERFLQRARQLTKEYFGSEASHGQADTATRIALTMATLDAAELIAASHASKDA